MCCVSIMNYISVFADIATILGAFSVFFAVINYFKNRFSAKNIKLDIHKISDQKYILNFSNFTDKSFSIIKIELKSTNTVSMAQQVTNGYPVGLWKNIENISFLPHESKRIDCDFLLETSLNPQKNYKLYVYTTQGVLHYAVKTKAKSSKEKIISYLSKQ